MNYFTKIFSKDFLLSQEVPSNSVFRAVRELEAETFRSLPPFLVLVNNSLNQEKTLEDFIKVLHLLENSMSLQSFYDFGKLVPLGQVPNIENFSLKEFEKDYQNNLHKAFSIKDAKSFIRNIISDFSLKLFSENFSLNLFAKNLKSALTSVTQSLFLGGMVDSLLQGDSPEDVYVIRIPYPGACKHCIRIFLDDLGAPRVFRLSDLIMNGEDLYRKPSEYVPVLYQLHFNCRCSILRISPYLSPAQRMEIYNIAKSNYTEAVKQSQYDATFVPGL